MNMEITFSDLRKIVKECVNIITEENKVGYLTLKDDNGLRLEFIEKDDILKISNILWNMLVMSYENIGGIKTYRSMDDFLRKAKYAKVVYNNSEIVSCAIYRNIEGSFKMVAIGCNQEEDGKLGIQKIIKDDIEKLDFHFWAEVSGAIEHYFKKYNGYPMPNILAPEILNIPSTSIKLSSNDNVHYEREISNEWYEKMIFGAKSREIYDAAIKAVENYSKFMEEVNFINESNNKLKCKYTLKQAMYIVENIYRAHEEDNINELIPSWHRALLECKKTLTLSHQDRTTQDYIEYCDYLLDTMPLLELHPLRL